jgi:hypothetical protein
MLTWDYVVLGGPDFRDYPCSALFGCSFPIPILGWRHRQDQLSQELFRVRVWERLGVTRYVPRGANMTSARPKKLGLQTIDTSYSWHFEYPGPPMQIEMTRLAKS